MKKIKLFSNLLMLMTIVTLFVYGVYAALSAGLSMSGSIGFIADGVFVGISGNIKTSTDGVTYTNSYDSGSKDFNEILNFTKNGDLPNGEKSTETFNVDGQNDRFTSNSAWDLSDLIISNDATYLQIQLVIKNYSNVPVAVRISDNISNVTNLEISTMTPDGAIPKHDGINPGETMYKLTFHITSLLQNGSASFAPQLQFAKSTAIEGDNSLNTIQGYTVKSYDNGGLFKYQAIPQGNYSFSSWKEAETTESFSEEFYSTKPNLVAEYSSMVYADNSKLVFTLNKDKASYSVKKHSSYNYANDSYLAIPFEWGEEGDKKPVTTIPNNAFQTSKINKVILPSSITSIGDMAFYNCTNLTSITIPEGVTTIGSNAFNGCSKLTSISIPQSTTNIGETALAGCSGLNAISVAKGNENYSDNGNCLINKQSKLLIKGCNSSVIPADGSVTNIANSAFFNLSGLTSVVIPEGVTSIGDSAFSGCSNLSSVQISQSLTKLGKQAFNGCKSLESITIPSGITVIGERTFYNCNNLTNITFQESSALTEIGQNAFYNCQKLTSFTIPDGVTMIGSSAFANCNNLEIITIPDGVNSIGFSTFSKCNSLKNVTLPNSVTNIGTYLFEDCSELTSVTIPNNITTIGERVFSGCAKLESIAIPDKVTSIGDFAFYNCSNLGSVTIPNGVVSMGTCVFSNCDALTNITIPSGVTCIDYMAFSDCDNLTTVTIQSPSSLLSIGEEAFYNCGSLESITLPQGLTSIGENAFMQCSMLNNLTIPSSLTSIGESAFNSCYGLTTLSIPSSVKDIGGSAFKDCSGLTSLTISQGVNSIGDFAFQNCSALTSVLIPQSVTNIGSFAFESCSSLNSITIPGSVSKIRESTFANCSSLTSVNLEDGVESIRQYAFQGCYNVTSITLSNTLTQMASGVFGDFNSLAYKYTSDGSYYLGTSNNPYYYLVGAGSSFIDLNSNTKIIGEYAFSSLNNLSSITLPEGLISIGSGAFDNAQDSVFTIDDNGTKYLGPSSNPYKFLYKGTDSTTTMNNGTKIICGNAFSDCYSLELITISDSVISIEDSAFADCYSLNNITLSSQSNLKSIGSNAFNNCGISSITIPQSVTSIGEEAFADCSSLYSITYLGTIEQWQDVLKGSSWAYHISTYSVTCSDGEVTITE